jgi:predicted lipoprotein with Yx(FWY)xxD motif
MIRAVRVLILIGACFALACSVAAAASPTAEQLRQAALREADMPSGFTTDFTRAPGITIAGTPGQLAAAGFTNFAVFYNRFIPGTQRLETVIIILSDATAGPRAATFAPGLADTIYDIFGRGDPKQIATVPTVLGTDVTRYTRQGGTGEEARSGDVISWRQGDVFAMVAHFRDGYLNADATAYARDQATRLEMSFGGTATPAPTTTLTPAPTPSPTPDPSPTPTPTPTPTPSPMPVPDPEPMPPPNGTGRSATVLVRELPGLGAVLTDDLGFTLYVFDWDMPDISVCNDDCALQWPPLTVAEGAGDPVAPDGLPGGLGVITRGDGRGQVTYDGRPLYRYSGDLQAGDGLGDGFDGVWHAAVIAPAAEAAAVAGGSMPNSR